MNAEFWKEHDRLAMQEICRQAAIVLRCELSDEIAEGSPFDRDYPDLALCVRVHIDFLERRIHQLQAENDRLAKPRRKGKEAS